MASHIITGDAVGSAAIQAVVLLLLIRLLDVWEREPLWLLGLFALWGGVFAILIAGTVNDARLAALSPDFRVVWGAAWVAPVDEEITKGVALLIAYFISVRHARRRGHTLFDGPLDGMVFGAAVGIGFGFVEDLLYGAKYGLGVFNLRLGFLGLGLLSHAVFTASFGAGLGLGTWSRSWRGRIGFPALGLAVAMILHAIQDGFISFVLVTKFGYHTTAAAMQDQPLPSDLASRIEHEANQALTTLRIIDYGMVVVFFAALLYWVRYQRKVLAEELEEEVKLGVIEPHERDLIVGYGSRLRAYASMLTQNRYKDFRAARKMHQRVTDLAFSKWRISRIDPPGSPSPAHLQRIVALRQALTPGAVAPPAPIPAQATVALQRQNEARGSLVLGIVGLALGIFGVPILMSVAAIVVGLQARRDDPEHRVPPGVVLGAIGLVLWGGVFAVALSSRPS